MAWQRARKGLAHPAGRRVRPWLWIAAALYLGASLQAQTPDEPGPADGPAESDGQNALPNTRFEANIAFDRLVENESYEAAQVVGRRWVDLTIEEFGAESAEAADAYVEFAQAQSQAGEFEAAEENLLVAVEIYRKIGGLYSEMLLQPLVSLGDNYYSDAQYLNAVSAYNEARTVSRRVFGLLNEGQIEILDRMTRSFSGMNEYVEADNQQREALQLVERNHPQQSDEVLGAIYKYARWLRDSRRYNMEREFYARAVRIIREHYGEEDVRMLRPLRETGNSFRSQGAAAGQGISGLRQALEIAQSLPEPDAYALAQVWRDIGDWQTAFAKVDPGVEEYLRAWEALGAVPNGDAIREEWFSGIEYVFREPLSQRGLSAAPDAKTGYVLVKFDIEPAGRTANVEIVEAEPFGLKEEAVARHVRLSRFRPHLIDGQAVTARNMALKVTYRYQDPDGD